MRAGLDPTFQVKPTEQTTTSKYSQTKQTVWLLKENAWCVLK
jgi:hypothetical protein